MKRSDYESVQQHRSQLLFLVQQEVQSYISDELLTFDDTMFPSRTRLSGEYYLGDEYYRVQVNPVWYQISIMAHCLQHAGFSSNADQDYLGLNVWIQCDPKTWKFSRNRNTDSSVI